MYVSPTGPYLGVNGVDLLPAEVSMLPLPRMKIKRLAQFEDVITDEPYFIYLLGSEQ